MSQTIKLKRSSVAGNVPTTTQLSLGEVAINTHDGKMFIKKDDGTASVIEVGSVPTGYNNTNWDTAYSWGDHSTEGYLTSFDITTQTDPKYLRSNANDTYTGQLSLGSSGSSIYGSDNFPLVQVNSSRAYFGSTGRNKSVLASADKIYHVRAGTEYEIFTTHNFMDNSSNWNTAYGWGDHASAGYLTSYSETDTLQSVTARGSSTTRTISVLAGSQANHNLETSTSVATYRSDAPYWRLWQPSSQEQIAAVNGGEVRLSHDGTKKLATTATGVTITGTVTATGGNSNNWNTAYGWGDHSTQGYLTSETNDYVDSMTFSTSNGTLRLGRTGSLSDLVVDLDGRYQLDTAPSTPSITSTSVVNETIEVVFSQSSTSGIEYYEVWSDGGVGSYSLIAKITEQDFASSMSVVDTTFSAGTVNYRVFAVKNGIYSTAATTSRAFTAPTLDVSNLQVVPDLNVFHIDYNMPNSRFIDHVEIYADANASSSSLSRSNATIIYSGNSESFTYNIAPAEQNMFHQFWVEVV